jgi:hypothetical protein
VYEVDPNNPQVYILREPIVVNPNDNDNVIFLLLNGLHYQRIITSDGLYFNQRDRAEELKQKPPLDPPLDETHQDQEPQRERAQAQLQEPQLDPAPLDETHQDQEPTSHHPQSIPLHVPRSTNPINEFTSNDENFYGTFPTLFPLGCGLRKPGSIPTADAKHMLNQHSAIFGDSATLIFIMFNQTQRHVVVKALAGRVK